jgi:hypothetical protein
MASKKGATIKDHVTAPFLTRSVPTEEPYGPAKQRDGMELCGSSI